MIMGEVDLLESWRGMFNCYLVIDCCHIRGKAVFGDVIAIWLLDELISGDT